MPTPPFKILSIDGGGIRGILPAMVLAEIEKRTQKPIAELFDLIVGTSTGGILTLGLTVPQSPGSSTPRFKAEDLLKIYTEQGREIFPRVPVWSSIRSVFGSTYSPTGLERIAAAKFGDARLKDALKPVIVMTYDIENTRTHYFNSRMAKEDPDTEDFFLRDIVRATSAAPTYFEPFGFQQNLNGSLTTHTFVDGGVFANNPAMLGYTEAKIINDQQDRLIQVDENNKDANSDAYIVDPRDIAEPFFMLSLGTGSVKKPLTYQRTKKWGMLTWARPLIDILMQGSADTVDYQIKNLLPPDRFNTPRYVRITTSGIAEKDGDMSNASPTNIAALIEYGDRMITREDRSINQVCEILKY